MLVMSPLYATVSDLAAAGQNLGRKTLKLNTIGKHR